MLNEEKVRYMTELAIFEKNNGKEVFAVNRFFKSDFIGSKMFRAFFAYTVAFCLAVALWALYRMDQLFAMSLEDMAGTAVRGGVYYVLGLAVYLVITWRHASRKYDQAYRRQIMYTAKLRHLVNRYDRPDRKGGNSQ